ncbi:DUF3231 family protein [Alkalihalobacillus hemicellulosilyticus]|uniref:Sugar isomerase n=1 Tax=Halalkalibacter hemicellulosilyticusJCM 9152 TaxID=1236971 RepID=W4QHP9_9BACI|nr:DUF3231 family protein [Halalkalibacter hemicellulosilyticus]GAE31645.1 hypothetical protein JCM9152_3125 [Halalkalibacter hemicellulosilyticusJCM 9152]
MTKKHNVGLSSTEIAGLWATYINDSLSICITKHFLQHSSNEDVKSLIKLTFDLSSKHIEEIKNIFEKENIPIPKGFTNEDIDLSAPPLFFDLFPVSYVYGMSRIGLMTYGIQISNVAREDIRTFFSKCLTSTTELYNKTVNFMLSKGIYDRPPMIPYPDKVEFITDKETFLSKWLEKKRPLNVLELSEMFFNIERNYFGLILLISFIQVVKDDKIKKFLIKGKKLAKKQINFLNHTLINEDLLGTIMVNSEVTTSTQSPFSEKLIMNLITTLNTQGMTYIGHALSISSRTDLASEYFQLIPEILQYGKEGIDILIERGWMEEPPHAPDRG